MDEIGVLFDTDIGSNIDDALALAYLLRQPRCRLLGVTTVSGESHRRAACAAAVCHAAGRDDVPIHGGESHPLLFGERPREVTHYWKLSPTERSRFDTREGALEFLRRTIRGSSVPIVLLTTGPLTNIARLFVSDPEAAGFLHGWVAMAGAFAPHDHAAETNCRLDPVAAAIVYERWWRSHFWCTHPGPPSVSIGKDVTTRCTLPVAEARRLLTAPPLDTVVRMADEWLAGRDEVTFNDPLAAAAVFRPDVCAYARGEVTVETSATSPAAGATRLLPDAHGPHRVATSVDPDAFLQEFFSVFA